MNELVLSLIETLKREAEHYRKLAVLADRQKELLVAGKVDVLPENLRQAEKEVFALGPLTAGRNELLSKMAQAHQLKKMSLSEAIQRCPVEQAEELKTAVVGLVRSAKGLEEINQTNEKLLGNALSYVNFTLRLIRNGGKVNKTSPVLRTPEENKPSFVNRVV